MARTQSGFPDSRNVAPQNRFRSPAGGRPLLRFGEELRHGDAIAIANPSWLAGSRLLQKVAVPAADVQGRSLINTLAEETQRATDSPHPSTLSRVQFDPKEKAQVAGPLQSPLTDSNRRPPPYHGTSHPTGGNPWQRFALVFAVSAPVPFAPDCQRLHPRGSIKAPSHVRRRSAPSQIPSCPVRDGVERFELRRSSKDSRFAAGCRCPGFCRFRPRGG
jgi:hypothetical protein